MILFISLAHIPHHLKRGIKNLHDRRTDRHNSLPLISIQRDDAEQTLQERNIQQGKVQRHTETDGVDEHHVLPQWQRQQRLGAAQRVHSIEHLNDDKDGERDGGC